MYVSDDENELAKLVLWTNPPVDENTGRRRSGRLLEQLEDHPSLKSVPIPIDENGLFKFALKLKAINRPGLYVAYLLALALDGHPFACLIIAGIITKRFADGAAKNKTTTKRRIDG
jgi:hypothetical protein